MTFNRSIRNRGNRRSKRAVIDLDITSLLDILVIMLVFLLKSYNASGIVLNVPGGITLPQSESQKINTSGVIIQASTTTLWVDDEIIVKNLKKRSYFDHGGRRIIPLYNKLVRKKKLIKRVQKSSRDAKPFSGEINLIIDKTLKYSFIKKLMYTSAEAGFRRYKFVVLGEE